MSISRRGFFQFGAREVAKAVGSVVEHVSGRADADAPRLLRPPGALPEREFLKTCTGCDECVRACPKWAIRKAGPELGEAIGGTPVILPEVNPCWLCKDLPCIAACEPGALAPVADPHLVRMGRARVDSEQCFAAKGSICETCQERCPVRPRAILVTFGETPTVLADRCTGCGVCAYLCPADAIGVEPHA